MKIDVVIRVSEVAIEHAPGDSTVTMEFPPNQAIPAAVPPLVCELVAEILTRGQHKMVRSWRT